MKPLINAIMFGCTIALISLPALAREEQWDVTVAQFQSTFHLVIQDDGTFTGVSEWTCCSGTTNLIDGVIKNGKVTLNRHLADNEKGQTQVWTGVYYNNLKNVKGNCTGLGCPLAWSADVTVTSN